MELDLPAPFPLAVTVGRWRLTGPSPQRLALHRITVSANEKVRGHHPRTRFSDCRRHINTVPSATERGLLPASRKQQ